MKFAAKNDKHHQGFQITFQNRCTISVQFGKNSRCDQGKTTAEVAAWDENSNWLLWNDSNWITILDGTSDVMSHQTPDDVATMINALAKL